MEPVKIRGTWRFVDSNGVYHRMTEEEFAAYVNGVAAAPVEEPVVIEPVVEQPVVIEDPVMESFEGE